MRKFFFGLMILILLSVGGSQAAWAAEDAAASSVQESLDFSEIEEYVNQVDQEIEEHMPELSIRKFYEDIRSGNFSWNVKDIILNLLSYFFKEVVTNSGLLTKLLILAVASAVLSNLQSAFDKGNIAILGH
ncbi:MAG: hypothetical protein AAGU27_23565, partial [Dehalobacterium sp.]